MRSGFREQDCHEGLAASTESPIRTGHESSRVEIKETTIDQDSALSRFSPRSAESKEAKVARRKTLDWKWGVLQGVVDVITASCIQHLLRHGAPEHDGRKVLQVNDERVMTWRGLKN